MNASAEVDRTRDSVGPPLPLAAWQDTYATVHMWTQIVGKMRLAGMLGRYGPPQPDAMLLAFLESTCEAAAIAGDWDRQALER